MSLEIDNLNDFIKNGDSKNEPTNESIVDLIKLFSKAKIELKKFAKN